VPNRIGIAFSLSFVLCLTLAGCKSTEKNSDMLITKDIPIFSVKDGYYEGSMQHGPDTAKVRVTINNGKIIAINILEHRHGPWHGADTIADRVIAAQSLNVDSVSGATLASKVMLGAIENALAKGIQ
jgi:uncharacterized protein with FMN-binding domain